MSFTGTYTEKTRVINPIPAIRLGFDGTAVHFMSEFGIQIRRPNSFIRGDIIQDSLGNVARVMDDGVIINHDIVEIKAKYIPL